MSIRSASYCSVIESVTATEPVCTEKQTRLNNKPPTKNVNIDYMNLQHLYSLLRVLRICSWLGSVCCFLFSRVLLTESSRPNTWARLLSTATSTRQESGISAAINHMVTWSDRKKEQMQLALLASGCGKKCHCDLKPKCQCSSPATGFLLLVFLYTQLFFSLPSAEFVLSFHFMHLHCVTANKAFTFDHFRLHLRLKCDLYPKTLPR